MQCEVLALAFLLYVYDEGAWPNRRSDVSRAKDENYELKVFFNLILFPFFHVLAYEI